MTAIVMMIWQLLSGGCHCYVNDNNPTNNLTYIFSEDLADNLADDLADSLNIILLTVSTSSCWQSQHHLADSLTEDLADSLTEDLADSLNIILLTILLMILLTTLQMILLTTLQMILLTVSTSSCWQPCRWSYWRWCWDCQQDDVETVSRVNKQV